MKTDAQKKQNKHTFIEGILYFIVAFLSVMQTDLASEESYKYMNPGFRFWIILSIGAFIAGFNALKAFRSMTFGRAYNTPDAPLNAPILTQPIIDPSLSNTPQQPPKTS